MPKYHYIQLRVRHSKCVRDTPEWSSDEIAIGGVAIYHDFRTKIIPPVKLGQFHDGSTSTAKRKVIGMSMWGGDSTYYLTPLGLKRLFYHNPGTSGIPKYFSAVVVMAELDFGGGFGGWISNRLRPRVKYVAGKIKSRIVAEGVVYIHSYEKKALANTVSDTLPTGTSDDIFLRSNCITQKVVSYSYFPNGRRDTDNKSYYFYENEDHRTGGKYRLRMDWLKYY